MLLVVSQGYDAPAAMRATAVPAAILRAASADIPGARREKTTFYPTRTRSRSGSRPNSRGGDRGPVSRDGGARGRKRGPRRQGSRAARPVERPHLPRPPLAERELHAADLRAWQHSDFGAKDH